MGTLDNSDTSGVVPISSSAVQSANPNHVVLGFGQSFDSGENGALIVPTDVVLSGQALDFFPQDFTISQQSSGPTYSASLRYERDIVSVPENGGFYLKAGVDTRLSMHEGSFSVETRPPLDAARANIKSYARDEIEQIRDDLVSAGVSNPDEVINALGSASDQAIDYILDNPTEIRTFDASSVAIPDSVPQEARGVIENALQAVEDRIQQPDLQNGLSTLEEAQDLYDNGMTYDYQAYNMSAGAFIEAGNAVKDVDFAGINFDQVDYFVTARAGYGATIYNMGDDGIYGCYGPEASIGAGIRGHFNENMSGVARVDHNLGLDRDCPGGVTQEVDQETKLFVGFEYTK